MLSRLLGILHIAEVNASIIKEALLLSLADFDDAIQNVVAKRMEVDHIITRSI